MQDHGYADVYQSGPHVVSPATRRLLRDGHAVDLEAKVFDLILLLVENRERALGKQEVVAALWGHRPITDAALSQLVYKARRALDDDGERQAVIRTVYGRGLQWVAPVNVIAAEPAPDSTDTPPGQDDPRPPQETAAPAGASRPLRHRPRALWIGLGIMLLAGALSPWIIPRGLAPPAPPPRRIALLPIANETGTASLDWTSRGLPGLVASLLGGKADLDVIDPLQVARVWGFTPPKGRSHAAHLRYVTGADVLVSGTLRKDAGKLYALTLHVDPGTGETPFDTRITGNDPTTLGIDAVARIRRALKLDPLASSPFLARPRDPYLAETFARGIDLAMHGDWLGAKPYFVVVTKGQPGLLQARFLLAQAQASTDELVRADASYAALLADARRLGQARMAARILAAQVALALNRHNNAKALELASQAVASARQADDSEVLAGALLAAARINARLDHLDTARQQYDEARTLIEGRPIRALQPLLHNTMGFIANATSDRVAAIAAARAELAADEALGKERSSSIATFNLAYALAANGRVLEALPLLARTWNWSGRHQDADLQVAAGNLMTAQLYDMGLYREMLPLIDRVAQLANAQHNNYMRSQVLGLRAGGEYFAGDKAASLATCREVSGLVDPAQDPSTAIEKWTVEAFVAAAAAPADVERIRHRVDASVKQMADPAGALFNQALVHALAAAVAGDRKAASAALAIAANAPERSPDLLHQFALHIALISGDDTLAQPALRDFDASSADVSADTLRLYGAWSAHRGDRHGEQQASTRLDAMRRSALDVLSMAHFDPAAVSL